MKKILRTIHYFFFGALEEDAEWRGKDKKVVIQAWWLGVIACALSYALACYFLPYFLP